MKHLICRYILMLGVVAVGLAWGGEINPNSEDFPVTIAEARAGRPATPVSYAGVARRTTVGAGAPGVGARPANRGGPVNRVGRR